MKHTPSYSLIKVGKAFKIENNNSLFAEGERREYEFDCNTNSEDGALIKGRFHKPYQCLLGSVIRLSRYTDSEW
jgi:hypothetical protein